MRRPAAVMLAAMAVLALSRQALAQGGALITRSLGDEILRSLIWLVVAGVLFVLAFKIVDWTTPGDLRQQLAEGNTAMAIYVGSLAIAAAIIIAALVS